MGEGVGVFCHAGGEGVGWRPALGGRQNIYVLSYLIFLMMCDCVK